MTDDGVVVVVVVVVVAVVLDLDLEAASITDVVIVTEEDTVDDEKASVLDGLM